MLISGGKPGHHALCIRHIIEDLLAASVVGLPGLYQLRPERGQTQQHGLAAHRRALQSRPVCHPARG